LHLNQIRSTTLQRIVLQSDLGLADQPQRSFHESLTPYSNQGPEKSNFARLQEMRYVTIRKFSSESGYTEAAIRSKIANGTWRNDYVWRKAPDGRVLIDVDGYEAWVEMGAPSKADRANRYRPATSPAPLMSKGQRLGSPKPLV
jgi:hypothetical protein